MRKHARVDMNGCETSVRTILIRSCAEERSTPRKSSLCSTQISEEHYSGWITLIPLGNPSSRECEQHFRQAINLRPNNWYAHNWFGTYAKEVKQDKLESKLADQSALAGDQQNPVFRYNLGRLYFETTEYDETALAKAWELAVQSRDICLQSERWNSFARFPNELAWACATLRQRSTLTQGYSLDPSDVIEGDVE